MIPFPENPPLLTFTNYSKFDAIQLVQQSTQNFSRCPMYTNLIFEKIDFHTLKLSSLVDENQVVHFQIAAETSI